LGGTKIVLFLLSRAQVFAFFAAPASALFGAKRTFGRREP
jgi:hypothetical protein